ncbi:hypothetical protein [Tropicibacter sp. Alg240-R139]|uniref:hypothetical protein n=1 Tax=Tropicibacter sp. Alg240-R139 TaxID=2305991 RepID=UPI0013DFC341|nr:hypothetical protein [Tropicibacter sp. Alg240-R139]
MTIEITELSTDLIPQAAKLWHASWHTTAWLACTVGNVRAARFYGKNGWVNARTETLRFETHVGSYPVKIWRFEKPMA